MHSLTLIEPAVHCDEFQRGKLYVDLVTTPGASSKGGNGAVRSLVVGTIAVATSAEDKALGGYRTFDGEAMGLIGAHLRPRALHVDMLCMAFVCTHVHGVHSDAGECDQRQQQRIHLRAGGR